MRTFTQLRNFYGVLTNNSETANLSFADTIINDTIRRICADRDWDFLDDQATITTVASQQFYDFPYNYEKLINATVTIGTTIYSPIECPNRQFWDALNATTTYTSNTPEYFYIYEEKLGIFPTPSSSGNTITINYTKSVSDMTIADYTTGTIVTATNGSTAIVGSGTTWTKSMIGRYLQITPSNTYNNNGDGFWYQIANVPSATTITLTKNYGGNSVVASAATYTIAQVPIIPEAYQDLLAYEAASIFYTNINPDPSRADRMKMKADELLKKLIYDHDTKTQDPVIHDTERVIPKNPNLFISG